MSIGSYRVDGFLGAGGMGVVYRATDTHLNRSVAIKFLSDTRLDYHARERFEREARLASALNHPHILTVHDVGDHAGKQFLVTELVDGATLADWLNDEPRTWQQCAELMIGGPGRTRMGGLLSRQLRIGGADFRRDSRAGAS